MHFRGGLALPHSLTRFLAAKQGNGAPRPCTGTKATYTKWGMPGKLSIRCIGKLPELPQPLQKFTSTFQQQISSPEKQGTGTDGWASTKVTMLLEVCTCFFYLVSALCTRAVSLFNCRSYLAKCQFAYLGETRNFSLWGGQVVWDV